jgi:hypothetical protein
LTRDYTHTDTHAYTQVHSCTHVHIQTHAYAHACRHMCIYVHRDTCMHTRAHMHTDTRTYMHTHAYMHAQTHKHTRTHRHTGFSLKKQRPPICGNPHGAMCPQHLLSWRVLLIRSVFPDELESKELLHKCRGQRSTLDLLGKNERKGV